MAGGARSDQLVVIQIQKMFHGCVGTAHQRRFCKEYGLAYERMIELGKEQRDLLKALVSVDLLSSIEDGLNSRNQHCNSNSGKVRVVMAAVVAGTYPQIARIMRPPTRYVDTIGGALERDADAKEMKFYIPSSSIDTSTTTSTSTSNGTSNSVATSNYEKDDETNNISTAGFDRVFIHPSSLNFSNNSFKPSSFLLYSEIQLSVGPTTTSNTSKVYLRECSEVYMYALLLFGGEIQANYSNGTISIDGWIR